MAEDKRFHFPFHSFTSSLVSPQHSHIRSYPDPPLQWPTVVCNTWIQNTPARMPPWSRDSTNRGNCGSCWSPCRWSPASMMMSGCSCSDLPRTLPWCRRSVTSVGDSPCCHAGSVGAARSLHRPTASPGETCNKGSGFINVGFLAKSRFQG